MPVLQAKDVQKNLEASRLFPLYCFYGPEKMKANELIKRIRKHLFPEWEEGKSRPLSEEILYGTDVTGNQVLESAQSLALGGGTRFIVVKEAHALKEAEVLAELLDKDAKSFPKEELGSVVVLLQNSLDKRKKFSKVLTKQAAVVPCEAIPENEREAWIQFLAKRHEIQLEPETVALLRAQEPWSLDLMHLELEKLSLALISLEEEEARKVLTGSIGSSRDSEIFLDAFFSRRLKSALPLGQRLGSQPDQSLPLLGLMTWNARQLLLLKKDEVSGTRSVKLGPYMLGRLQRWCDHWELEEMAELQSGLSKLDFGVKQTRLSSTGLWDKLVMDFCH